MNSRNVPYIDYVDISKVMIFVCLNAYGISGSLFYFLCFLMAISVGYWVFVFNYFSTAIWHEYSPNKYHHDS